MDKPDVESITGLSPAISIEQKSGMHNPRSTVGTITEIYDYMRLLYARVGQAHCPSMAKLWMLRASVNRGPNTGTRTRDQNHAACTPAQAKKGEHKQFFCKICAVRSFIRVRVNQEVLELDALDALPANQKTIVTSLWID